MCEGPWEVASSLALPTTVAGGSSQLTQHVTTVGMSPVFLPSDSLIVSPNYASYHTDYEEESNRQIEIYPPTRISELSRSVIEAQIRKISEAKSEVAIYELLRSILNQACLDLAVPDDKTVLVFIENSRKWLQTMPETNTNTELPNLVGFC